MKRCKNGRVDAPLLVDTQTTPAVYTSRTQSGYIMTIETMDEVATVGMPVRHACVGGYLSLFINEFRSSGRGENIGLVDSGFIGHLSACGFASVHTWLTYDKSIQFIPAFFGPNDYGHWTALIIDTDINREIPTVAFVDSLSDRRGRFEALKRDLKNTPYDAPSARQLILESLTQAQCSNDCAFFMIGAFTHWVLRGGAKRVPTKLELQEGYDASRFGIEMRQHVFNSIVAKKVDLDSPILRAMTLI